MKWNIYSEGEIKWKVYNKFVIYGKINIIDININRFWYNYYVDEFVYFYYLLGFRMYLSCKGNMNFERR